MIAECLYDFESHKAGIFTIPIDLPDDPDFYGNVMPMRSLYDCLLHYQDTLVAIDIHGIYVAIVSNTECRLISPSNYETEKCFQLLTPLTRSHYVQIGWRKTYPKNLSVYHYPWYLLQDRDTGEVLDYNIKIENAAKDPHLSAYAQLRDTPYDAIYYDLSKGGFSYIPESCRVTRPYIVKDGLIVQS